MLMHIVIPYNKGHIEGFIGGGEKRGRKGGRQGSRDRSLGSTVAEDKEIDR